MTAKGFHRGVTNLIEREGHEDDRRLVLARSRRKVTAW